MVSSCLPSLAPLKQRKKNIYFPAGTKLLSNTGLSFFVKSSKTDRKHQAWGTVLSLFSHVLACPAKQLSQQTPLRRWQISVLMPSCLSRYCCLNFLLSIAPHHRFSLQNGYPVFPLILTPKQTTLEETMKNIGLSYRISLP